MSDLEVYKCVLAPSLAALVAILGWTVAHYFAQERDRKNRSKVLRNEYLISAYRTLFRVGLDRDVGKNAVDCENAISDIQLFGSMRQIELAKKYTQDMSSQGTADLTKLVKELRGALRSELNIEKTSDNIHFLKIERLDKNE